MSGIKAQATSLRRAAPADAAALSRLGRDTFVTTFGHLYPPADLAEFLAEAHAPHRYTEWLNDPEFAIWALERDGEMVGYALAGPCHLPHPEVTADCGELWRIYVRGELHGQGLGTVLLEAALAWLERPRRRLWIGVWSGNLGAQKLYARRGFHKVGGYQFPVGSTLDDEFILRREPDRRGAAAS
jgi:GNAT superfamily N-acetyltransferase